MNFALAIFFGSRIELAEALEDVGGLEVEPFDLVIVTAALDGGPFDDAGGGSAEGVAHVRLLINFIGTGAGLAISEELFTVKLGVFGAIDNVNDAEFDGVRHRDAEVEIPRTGARPS